MHIVVRFLYVQYSNACGCNLFIFMDVYLIGRFVFVLLTIHMIKYSVISGSG